jgi:hypothetical protein
MIRKYTVFLLVSGGEKTADHTIVAGVLIFNLYYLLGRNDDEHTHVYTVTRDTCHNV